MLSYGAWFCQTEPKRIVVPTWNIVFEGHTFEAYRPGGCATSLMAAMDLPPRDKRDRHKGYIIFYD